MDYSKTVSVGDLKAPSTSGYAIDESKTLASHCFAPEHSIYHSHHGGKVITDADWPDLKPIIHRLYIIDNLTFLKVQEALNFDLGYNITKRQFTRKVEAWGFKKNFRKNERDEIVKSGKIPQRLIHDSRINPKRVERLQKRNVVRMGLGVESEDNERSLVQDQDFSPETNAIKEASLDLEPCYTMTGDQNAALEEHDMTMEEIPRSEFRDDMVTKNTDDERPFSQSAKDDSGISWLAELFVQLEIAEIIAPTSVEPEKQGDVEEARFISGTALKELLNPHDNNLVCGGSFRAQGQNYYPYYLSARSTSLQTCNPGIHQCHWSPLFEIDIFPPSKNSNNHARNNLIHSFTSLRNLSIDLEAKLAKLERVLPANSPAIISTLECLAFVYHRILQREKGVMAYRKLLHARQKEKFPNTYKMLDSCLWIVDCCLALGNLKIGMNLHTILHPRIENAVDPQHPLRIHSSYLMAEIFYKLHQYSKAEDIICPLMQIVLATLGHNHFLTIRVMNRLSSILRRKLYLGEANRLARYSLQVSVQSDLGGTWFESARALIYILELQGLFNESTDLYHHLFKLSAETIDCKEDAFFSHHIYMAAALLKQSKASRAVDMLRGVQDYSYAFQGQPNFLSFEAILGHALQAQGNFEEVIYNLKKALKLTVELNGWDYAFVYLLVMRIANGYEGLSRYDKVLEIYEKLLQKWKMTVEKGSPVKVWIKDIEDRIREVRGGTRGDDESILKDDDDEEHETDFGNTEMEGFDIREEENDVENYFGVWQLSFDAIFNRERDNFKDITSEELVIDKIIIA